MFRLSVFALLTMFVCNASAEDHALFTALLKDHVSGDRIRYASLCKDGRLRNYIDQLSAIDPGKLSVPSRELSYWLNAYNAYTLKVICDHYPLKSINELHAGGVIIGTSMKGTIWDKKIARIPYAEVSLNHIEHEIIRKKFHEPRIHFALVCAAASCPPLRSEAYEPETLDRQLDDQGRIFFADRGKNRFDLTTRTAHLSTILNWYSSDFGKSKEDVLRFVARFLPADIRAAIESAPAGWTIRYTEYDWGLNDWRPE